MLRHGDVITDCPAIGASYNTVRVFLDQSPGPNAGIV